MVSSHGFIRSLRTWTHGVVKPCAFLGFVLLLAGGAFANNSKISPDLQPLLANPSTTVNVIVQYNSRRALLRRRSWQGCSARPSICLAVW